MSYIDAFHACSALLLPPDALPPTFTCTLCISVASTSLSTLSSLTAKKILTTRPQCLHRCPRHKVDRHQNAGALRSLLTPRQSSLPATILIHFPRRRANQPR